MRYETDIKREEILKIAGLDENNSNLKGYNFGIKKGINTVMVSIDIKTKETYLEIMGASPADTEIVKNYFESKIGRKVKIGEMN